MIRAGAGRSRGGLGAAASPEAGRSLPGGAGQPLRDGVGPGERAPSVPQLEPPGAYVVIPPNLARRNQLQRIANQELEELEKWKEQHRPGPINLIPQKLGGRASEADVRRKQQLEHSQSKYQQKLKRETYGRIKREAEEAELLKKKAIQREKANKLEEKRRQEQWQRGQTLDEDDCLGRLEITRNYTWSSDGRDQFPGRKQKTTELLTKLALDPSQSTSCHAEGYGLGSTPWARSRAYKELQRQEEDRKLQEMKEEQRRKAEMLERKQKQEERARVKAQRRDQQRVNKAFLDRLQHNNQPSETCSSGGLGYMDFSADDWEADYFL